MVWVSSCDEMRVSDKGRTGLHGKMIPDDAPKQPQVLSFAVPCPYRSGKHVLPLIFSFSSRVDIIACGPKSRSAHHHLASHGASSRFVGKTFLSSSGVQGRNTDTSTQRPKRVHASARDTMTSPYGPQKLLWKQPAKSSESL